MSGLCCVLVAGLRVFVSSTMRDLANERSEVVDRLARSNYEPVNAELIDPTGAGSWDRIQRELSTCDVFVLILGETYGWIPSDGPFAGQNKSVTELEFDEAVRLDLPVLAFFKKLGYSADRSSTDAALRDAFRDHVASWADGVFRREFDLARDLADGVARAVSTLLTERFREQIRDSQRARVGVENRPPNPPEDTSIHVPTALVDAVIAGDVVVFLGAGVSMGAGMPSALAFADRITQRIQEIRPGYETPASGTALNAVAADLEALAGRPELETTVGRMMLPPLVLLPTEAHRLSAQLFSQLITTNFDTLLEEAFKDLAEIAVVDGELVGSLPERAIIKLHGAIRSPGSLVLTDHDLVGLPRARPNLWREVLDLLRRKQILAVGTSLRDPSLVALLDEVGTDLRGWAVMYRSSEAARLRLLRWSLEPIDATADAFLSRLNSEVLARSNRDDGQTLVQ